MSDEELRELVGELLGAGAALAGVLGAVLARTLDGDVRETDVTTVRELILCWHRIETQCQEMLSLTA